MSREEHNHILQKFRDDPTPYKEFREVLKIIGDKWSVLILVALFDCPRRFSEVADELPDLNPRTLTAKLRQLEHFGLITRCEYKEFPPRTEYSVTQKAHELKEAMLELKKWARKYCNKD